MTLLFDLDDFEETRVEWTPIPVPPSPYDGLDEREMIAAHKADNASAWKAWQKTIRCRDCGGLMKDRPAKMSCSGARDGLSFELCDDCAALDGAYLASHTTVIEDRPPHFGWSSEPREAAHCEDCGWWLDAERWDDDDPRARVPLTPDEVIDLCAQHETPKWRSRWGVYPYTTEEHERLITGQARRRARYLAIESMGVAA